MRSKSQKNIPKTGLSPGRIHKKSFWRFRDYVGYYAVHVN
jgi:hypothetical protein